VSTTRANQNSEDHFLVSTFPCFQFLISPFLHLEQTPVDCSLVPSGKIRGKIRPVTLHTILDTRSNFHMFRQEFERANRNAAFVNHCNSEDGKCELHVHSFTILACTMCCVWLQLRQLMPWLHSTEVRASIKNSAQC